MAYALSQINKRHRKWKQSKYDLKKQVADCDNIEYSERAESSAQSSWRLENNYF
jgi:hypothetical protein